MALGQIKAMPVADLAAENAHCWLWVTNATLRHGYDVLEAWGFTPRSVFSWIKPRLGLSIYLRNATEHVLLGTRGKAPVQNHGHKPEEQCAIIQRVSPGPYLELFARRGKHLNAFSIRRRFLNFAIYPSISTRSLVSLRTVLQVHAKVYR
ncbi:MAG: hypothetical protein LBU32_09340 [Clostridiales bacterium]|jgi:N6-adenosine-specific RNA methylase IME4|nr:hypothetical protein [Clostridiales bacterium]